MVTNFVQFQTTNICYNSAISPRTSLFIMRRNIGPAAAGPARPAATALHGNLRHLKRQKSFGITIDGALQRGSLQADSCS